MSETEYQAAHAELDEAIKNFMGRMDYPGVVTGYVVVAHVASFDSEGDQVQEYPMTGMRGEQPLYISMGLLEIGKNRLTNILNSPYEED